MKIKILGRCWNLRFVSNLGPNNGTCDSPDTPNKEIRLQLGLNEREECRVLLHECLHAANWHTYSEEYVDQLSKDLSNILWRQGWRKTQ